MNSAMGNTSSNTTSKVTLPLPRPLAVCWAPAGGVCVGGGWIYTGTLTRERVQPLISEGAWPVASLSEFGWEMGKLPNFNARDMKEPGVPASAVPG